MKVINLFAGPGAGKSVLACELFAEMKKRGCNVELVTEYAKDMVWEKRGNILSDQLYILAKQNRRLTRLQEAGVEWAVTDGPLPFGIIYGQDDSIFKIMVWKCFREFDNYNVILDRNPQHVYQPEGRVQGTVDEAKVLDGKIEALLRAFAENSGNPNIRHEVGYDTPNTLFEAVLDEQERRIREELTPKWHE